MTNSEERERCPRCRMFIDSPHHGCPPPDSKVLGKNQHPDVLTGNFRPEVSGNGSSDD